MKEERRDSLSHVQLFATPQTVGSSVQGILQARILKWVAIPFSRNLPYLGIEPGSSTLQADYLPPELPGRRTGPCKTELS